MIKKREQAGIKNLKDPTAIIEYSDTMDDIYEKKVLIVFDDMISYVMSNKKAQQVLKELFIRCRKLRSAFVLSQCSKRCEIKLYSLYYF